eukprot:GHVN01042225.1.p1 GENE.GHVN01042225.1~~GHVN01042225.1.p1  ORF type:complete len:414 (+),score=112.04 GHVN01042225.1:406-1647(+)
MIPDHLTTAFTLSHLATASDRRADYPNALNLYKQSLTHWAIVWKEQKDPNVKEKMWKKMNEFVTRAEQIKAFLKQQELKKGSRGDTGGTENSSTSPLTPQPSKQSQTLTGTQRPTPSTPQTPRTASQPTPSLTQPQPPSPLVKWVFSSAAAIASHFIVGVDRASIEAALDQLHTGYQLWYLSSGDGENEEDGEGDEMGGDSERGERGGCLLNSEEIELREALKGVIAVDSPSVQWDEVAGLNSAKQALREAVEYPAKYPSLFSSGQLSPWKGILLYGPPGTGKTHLARACATEAKCTFFNVSSTDLLSKWQGESEKLVRLLFSLARERSPSVVFIDEVDSLVKSRSDSESESCRRIKTELLVQMDGMTKGGHVLVLGATNLPWELDAGFRRRFEKRIYISLPDAAARQKTVRC